MRALRRERVEQERAAVGDLYRHCERAFELTRFAILGMEGDIELDQQLMSVDPDPSDEAFSRPRQALVSFLDDLQRVKDNASATLVKRLERRRDDPAVAAVAARIRGLIDAGELATADEFLVLAESGAVLASEEQINGAFSDFFPTFVDHVVSTPLDASLIDALARGTAFATRTLDRIGEAERGTVLRGLRAWLALRNPNADMREQFPTVLRLLGLEVENDRVSRPQQRRVDGGEWIDVHGARIVGKALIPSMGSRRGGHFRFLRLSKPWGIEWFLNTIGQSHDETSLLVVLYPGALTTDQREELALRVRGDDGRDLVVIDDAVVLYTALHGGGRWDLPVRLMLPFTGMNPFVPNVTGNVPPEMFYGRKAEVRDILDPDKTSFVYGGRQLGKSALLREAQRRHSNEDGPAHAVYIDLIARGVGTYHGTEELWNYLADALRDVGLPIPDRNYAVDQGALLGAIQGWVREDVQRRLLVLLDECDLFFDADYKEGFRHSRLLKGLTDDSNRRVRVVFAGLHKVLRYQREFNQPFAHLGPQKPLGPLQPRYAFNLVAKPFAALGYQFESPDLIHRLLNFTNYAPSIIQLVCDWLLNHVLRRRIAGGRPPYLIKGSVVDEVLANHELLQQVRDRFDWTVSLDPRYEVIAYTVVLNAYDNGPYEQMPVDELKARCSDVRGHEFDSMAAEVFTGFLDELVGLGVLAATPARDHYGLRSPNVLRLVGQRERAVQRIEEAAERPLETGFDPNTARRRMSENDRRCSPLTAQQLRDLLIADGRARVVIGSKALGIDLVEEALTGSNRQLAHLYVATAGRSGLRNALSQDRAKPTVVVLKLLKGTDETARAAWDTVQNRLVSGLPLGVVLIIGPSLIDWWLGAPGYTSPGGTVLQTALRRWDLPTLAAWRREEQRFDVPEALDHTLEVTGGWWSLIDRASALAADEATSWDEALGTVAHDLEDTESAEAFLADAGLSRDGDERRLLQLVVQVGGSDQPPSVPDLEDYVAREEGLLDPNRVTTCLRRLELLQLASIDRQREPGRPALVTPEPAIERILQRLGGLAG